MLYHFKTCNFVNLNVRFFIFYFFSLLPIHSNLIQVSFKSKNCILADGLDSCWQFCNVPPKWAQREPIYFVHTIEFVYLKETLVICAYHIVCLHQTLYKLSRDQKGKGIREAITQTTRQVRVGAKQKLGVKSWWRVCLAYRLTSWEMITFQAPLGSKAFVIIL